MEITLEGLVSYIEGIDERVVSWSTEKKEDTVKYGLQNLASLAQCFQMEETIPLKGYIDTGYLKFDLVPVKDIIDYNSIYVVETDDDKKIPVSTGSVFIEKRQNKTLNIIIEQTAEAEKLSIVIGYYFNPVIENSNALSIETEIYHYLKHSIQVVVWGSLKDYEKEQYHQKVMEDHLRHRAFSYPTGLGIPVLKGGFV